MAECESRRSTEVVAAVAGATLIAAGAVRGGYARTGQFGCRIRPQVFVHFAEKGDGKLAGASVAFEFRLVGWAMVDETAIEALAKAAVMSSEHQEGVPHLVEDLRGGTRLLADDGDVEESLHLHECTPRVLDGLAVCFGKPTAHAFVLIFAHPFPEDFVIEALHKDSLNLFSVQGENLVSLR